MILLMSAVWLSITVRISLSRRTAMPTTSFASPSAVICQVDSSSEQKSVASASLEEVASMSSTWTARIVDPVAAHREYTHHSHSVRLNPHLRNDVCMVLFQMRDD